MDKNTRKKEVTTLIKAQRVFFNGDPSQKGGYLGNIIKQSETIESMVIKNQFHAEKFAVEGLKLKDPPWYKKDDLIYWKTLLYIPPNPQL